jgi:hypothetical protein
VVSVKPASSNSRDESNVPRAFTANNDNFLLIDNPIQNGGQVFTQAAVHGFSRHQSSLSTLYGIPVRPHRSNPDDTTCAPAQWGR